MTVEICLTGASVSEELLHDLEEWINQEPAGGPRAKVAIQPAEPGKMGGDLSTFLSVILGSVSMVNLVQCIHTWIKARKPRIKITLKYKDGDKLIEVGLDVDNPADMQKSIDKVIAVFQKVTGK